MTKTVPLDYLYDYLRSGRDGPVLSDTQEHLTREDLTAVYRAIAHAIASKAPSADRQIAIAILLDRSVYYLASMFAAWQLGAYFVPLNTRWPAARVNEIVSHCRADIVICHRQGDYHEANAIYLEDIDTTAKIDDIPRHCADPADLAYVIYTSGSTGTPKGVMIRNESYCTYIEWTRRYFSEYRANKRLLITSELTFDITMGDIAFAFAFNTSIVVAPDPKNIVVLLRIINEYEIDTFYSVPTTHSILFNFIERKRGLHVDSIKLIISGGDAFSIDLVKTIKSVTKGAHFHNVYGPTEVTINCFATRIDDLIDEIERQGEIPIGVPFDVIDAVILDDDGDDVTERGRPGRLCVTGPQVMLGYFADRETTEGAFVADPRSPNFHRRLYDTGDLAIKRPDGLFYLLGRSDNLVKIKGYRVHPDETTRALTSIGEVHDAATLAVEGRVGKKLVSFVTMHREIDESEIYTRISEIIPDYMIPSEIYFIDDMPLNNSRKIDKIALQRLYAAKLARG